MQTLTINDTLAERLATLVRNTGKTEEQVILHALDKFSNAAIMQRYGRKEL